MAEQDHGQESYGDQGGLEDSDGPGVGEEALGGVAEGHSCDVTEGDDDHSGPDRGGGKEGGPREKPNEVPWVDDGGEDEEKGPTYLNCGGEGEAVSNEAYSKKQTSGQGEDERHCSGVFVEDPMEQRKKPRIEFP